VSATTAAIPSGRASEGAAYAPNASAIAARLAIFPTTNPKPARKPKKGPSRSRP
jgi:hypothetical protein